MMAIRECRNSGLSVRAWRQQQGITPTTYYRWEQEVLSLAGDAAELSGRELVELPAVEQGIITGYPNGTFNPKGQATRAEVAIIITRFLAKLKD